MKAMKMTALMLALLLGSASAIAEDGRHAFDMPQMSTSVPDTRERVDYPPEVKAFALMNMRRHLMALSDILTALGAGQYDNAAQIAKARLGMESNDATACRTGEGGMTMPMDESTHAEHRMAQLMPPKWRELGQNMHNAADEFAAAATKANNPSPADEKAVIAALAKVSQQCIACHKTFRMQ